jgi:hypothetical protein
LRECDEFVDTFCGIAKNGIQTRRNGPRFGMFSVRRRRYTTKGMIRRSELYGHEEDKSAGLPGSERKQQRNHLTSFIIQSCKFVEPQFERSSRDQLGARSGDPVSLVNLFDPRLISHLAISHSLISHLSVIVCFILRCLVVQSFLIRLQYFALTYFVLGLKASSHSRFLYSSHSKFIDFSMTGEESFDGAGAGAGAGMVTLPPADAQHRLCCAPFPSPGTPGAPYFNGANISEFLQRFHQLGVERGLSESDMMEKLPSYCEFAHRFHIEGTEGFKTKDWEMLKKQLLKDYWRNDTRQQMYSRTYLEMYKDVNRTEQDDVLTYCRNFNAISAELVAQNQLDGLTRALWFLKGLPKKLQKRVMHHEKIDLRNASALDYEKIYKRATETQETADTQDYLHHGQELVKEVISLNAVPKRTDPVIVQTDGTFPVVPMVSNEFTDRSKSKPKSETKMNEDRVMDELTKKLEALTLAVTALVSANNQQLTPCGQPQAGQQLAPRPTQILPRPPSQPPAGPRPLYNPTNQPEITCFGCGKLGHGTRRCPEINALLARNVIHRNEQGRICEGPEGSDGDEIAFTRGTPWKDAILHQLEVKNLFGTPKVNVSSAETVIPVQTITVCGMGENGTHDDTDDEYTDPETGNELDVYVAVARPITRSMGPANPVLEKGKRVIQGRIEKEKKYPSPKLPRFGEYVDAPRKIEVPDSQGTQQTSQTIGDTVPLESSSDDVVMRESKGPVIVLKKAPAQKGKKLAKELKDYSHEAAEKVLQQIMSQEIRGVTFKDLLGSSPILHRMMFQNLPPEPPDSVNVGFGGVTSRTDDEIDREQLYSVGTLRYPVEIGKGKVDALLDGGAEVNVLLYHIAMELGLAVHPNVNVAMKNADGERSGFIGYCPDVPVRIGSVVVRQPFFVLERGSNSCLLGRPFENITRLLKQTMNNGAVRVTVFDPKDDSNQITFQAYTPGDPGDRTSDFMVGGQQNEDLN